jgi:hypothetical protein
MAARKRKTARKASKAKRVKKVAARTSKKAAKSASRKSAKRPAKKAKKPARKSLKAAAKKAPAKRAARGTVGEGDYAASRAFLKDQSRFVEKNKAKIPAMGKAAEAALDGPDGAALRDAEATAAARSRDIF